MIRIIRIGEMLGRIVPIPFKSFWHKSPYVFKVRQILNHTSLCILYHRLDSVLHIQNLLLLDYILFRQPLVDGSLPLIVKAKAGLVEHEAFERANAGSNASKRSSDHRPVTCVLSDSPRKLKIKWRYCCDELHALLVCNVAQMSVFKQSWQTYRKWTDAQIFEGA
ncbi:MAG: hypothetical protein OEM26_11125 [Saprospiraceae bacterium]|nr:hypothetical protein [Saprospiraceae bacterium]